MENSLRQICGQSNHCTERCFLNKINAANKLNVSADTVSNVVSGTVRHNHENGWKINRFKSNDQKEEHAVIALNRRNRLI